MKTKVYVIAATVLFAGFAVNTAAADTKRVPKGRAGYAYVQVNKKQQDAQRQTTIALDLDQKRSQRKVRAHGRGVAGWRLIKR